MYNVHTSKPEQNKLNLLHKKIKIILKKKQTKKNFANYYFFLKISFMANTFHKVLQKYSKICSHDVKSYERRVICVDNG